MSIPVKKTLQTKCILAVVFAAGMLNSSLPALAETRLDSSCSLIQLIANDEQDAREIRAYYLLQLASEYLWGQRAITQTEEYWRTRKGVTSRGWLAKNLEFGLR